MLRKIRLVAYALITVLVVIWGAFWLREKGVTRLGLDDWGLSLPGGVSVGGPFSLVDTAGRPVSEATYRGRWMLIYFGYTFCPDVCPTGLQTVASALDQMGQQAAAQVVPVFITVDPERDTPATLAEYTKLFDERIVGLTGTAAQIAATARSFRVYYAKATPKDSTQYLMDHTSFFYLIGPDGSFRTLFKHGIEAPELAAALKTAIAGKR